LQYITYVYESFKQKFDNFFQFIFTLYGTENENQRICQAGGMVYISNISLNSNLYCNDLEYEPGDQVVYFAEKTQGIL
jgi:hypothetical protein